MNEQPWDALSDAAIRLEDAKRAVQTAADEIDTALAHAELVKAQQDYDFYRDRLGLVAAVILQAAVGGFGHDGTSFWGGGSMTGTPINGYVLKDTLDRFAQMIGFDHCWDAMVTADDRFKEASEIARAAYSEAKFLRREVQSLKRQVEDLIANRTVGVGEPALRFEEVI